MSSEDKPTNSSQPTPISLPKTSLPSRKSSFLTIVKAQISFLLSTLSENTYAKSVGEIQSVRRDGTVWTPLEKKFDPSSQTNPTLSFSFLASCASLASLASLAWSLFAW